MTSQPADLDIAQDLALQLGGQHSTALRWFRHDENLGAMNTQLNVDLSLDPESAIYVERTGAGGACTPTLELQATMVFETEDQTFTEELSGTLQHTSYGSKFTASLPLDQVRGSYNFSAIENIERYSALSLRTTISPLQGELFLSPDSNNSSPSNVVLTSPSIAEWGTTLPED